MVDFNVLQQYFDSLLFFDWGDTTLVAILAVFGAMLTWLSIKALLNLIW